ncbi:hypothetical protein L228DRAFT_248827 [Xylona heveae TC161]|uniref:Uncharacterized protein n=1 Tax=Xylona heveae (strain CBS 132557 / TC161) TaxID=1328760 RepID=A0A165FJY4_XYLHT|nr:hypothetical protein L228DRAFT_248827 [Xylona heveae TC161]KZF21064.1 hypothetical protein L228DRAFT_248827 [Xylona heveae TC161]
MRNYFELPGFTLALNYEPQGKYNQEIRQDEGGLFESALSVGEGFERILTLREITMLQIMNEVTDKPEWNRKVFDKDICNKWRAEALGGGQVTEKMMDWVIAEIQYKVKAYEENGMITAYNDDIVKSDTSVEESIKNSLKKAVAFLENVPDPYKDYHPGSNDQVLDLVHPSLFPLVYGRSRILRDERIGLEDCVSKIGHGEILAKPKEAPSPPQYPTNWNFKPYSHKFQWLPCDVAISSTSSERNLESEDDTVPPGNGCKIMSYINNLHPHTHNELYPIIEKIIVCAIPLWNKTLDHQRRPLFSGREKRRIEYNIVDYEEIPEHLKPQQLPGEDEDDYDDRIDGWDRPYMKVIQPEPGEFRPPPEYNMVDLRKQYAENGLQVIVKLANIELTPEKPEYTGGSWHVEGQKNEHICATALYYYDSENITESRLSFRHCTYEDMIDVHYPQEEHGFLTDIFGCEQHGSTVQYLGDVICKEGRLLTFPNTLQHRVGSFRLADPTKPGHRKILALFLVDPNIRVISTANIPPQRQDWWRDELARRGALSQLPPEIQSEVLDQVDFPMSLDEAKALRLELMDERRAYVATQDDEFNKVKFNLCEH